MIIFPVGFCKTKYPGYFWNSRDKQLYSIKSGTLKPLKQNKPVRIPSKYIDLPAGYRISIKGRSKFISLESLEKIVYYPSVEFVDTNGMFYE